MFYKLLKSLVLALAFGISAVHAGTAVAAEPAAMPATGLLDTPFVTLQQTRSHASMADCCQTGGEQAGCQHCSDNSCESGTCGSCSHCVTALLHDLSESSDSDPAYRQIPVKFFLSFYQATEPRPPRS